MSNSPEKVEVCPNDGQTLAWHMHAELGPDGRPRTNAQFIGCDWVRPVEPNPEKDALLAKFREWIDSSTRPGSQGPA